MIVQRKYFEDYEVGQRWVTLGRTITETDITNWVTMTGLHSEMFMNREAAKETVYGRLVVPAMLTEAIASGLFAHTGATQGASSIFLSLQCRAIGPLFIGDTIRDEVEVSSTKRTSKPDRGVVTFLHSVINQHGQPIISFNTSFMFMRRPELVEAEE